MANVLTNFIVGLGFDVDNRSLDQATSSIDKIGSTAKQVGAAMLGGFGLKALTLDLAKSNSELGRFSEKMGVNAQFIKSLGTVYKDFGGDISTAMSDVALVESMRTMTEDQLGGAFASAGMTGFNASLVINAESAEKALKNIADLMEKMPRTEQLQIQRNLGFSDSLFFASEGGADALQQRVDLETQKNPITQEHIENSKELERQYNDLMATFGAFSDRIGNSLIPTINSIVMGVNGWLDANRDLINSGLDKFLGSVSEHFDKIAIVLAVLTAGKTISALNMLKSLSSVGGGGGGNPPDLNLPNGGGGGRRRGAKYSKMDLLTSIPLVGTGLTAIGTTELGSKALDVAELAAGKAADYVGEKAGEFADYVGFDTKAASDAFDVGYKYVDDFLTAQLTPSETQTAMTPPTAAQATQVQQYPININLTSTLDGKVLDERIVTVTGEQYYVNEQETISTTAG